MNVELFTVFQEWTAKKLLKNCRLVFHLVFLLYYKDLSFVNQLENSLFLSEQLEIYFCACIDIGFGGY